MGSRTIFQQQTKRRGCAPILVVPELDGPVGRRRNEDAGMKPVPFDCDQTAIKRLVKRLNSQSNSDQIAGTEQAMNQTSNKGRLPT